ncbi:hypothetical protein [Luteimonas aquatica]|uniref:hypothetical protein n=1 Tax=Luteimonas aquatica TaxID=450364 RepID=UPI001F59B9E0|nr:hypothetical protein [Luteimonas aquatica]
MRAELARWNNGAGIDLEGWTNGMGNYGLAIGYLTVFWPEFVEYDGYILREGFSLDALRAFERQEGATRKSIECVMNHLHLIDIHSHDDDEFTEDKIIVLGHALKEIYQAKLTCKFPHAPCIVEFREPENGEDFYGFQISFWQASHEPSST